MNHSGIALNHSIPIHEEDSHRQHQVAMRVKPTTTMHRIARAMSGSKLWKQYAKPGGA